MPRPLLVALFLLATPLLPARAQDSASGSPPPAFVEYVVLAEGDTLRGDGDIRDPFLGSAQVVVNDSTELALKDVAEVNNAEGNFAVGRPSLTKTLMLVRRVEAGRISLYSKTVSTPGMWMPGPNGTQTYSGGGSSTYEYFRVGTGPVQNASTSNLRMAPTTPRRSRSSTGIGTSASRSMPSSERASPWPSSVLRSPSLPSKRSGRLPTQSRLRSVPSSTLGPA